MAPEFRGPFYPTPYSNRAFHARIGNRIRVFVMSTFDDRENAFEAKFAHDQEKEFRAEMMALRQIAVWGVSLMHVSPEEKEHRTAALHSLEI